MFNQFFGGHLDVDYNLSTAFKYYIRITLFGKGFRVEKNQASFLQSLVITQNIVELKKKW